MMHRTIKARLRKAENNRRIRRVRAAIKNLCQQMSDAENGRTITLTGLPKDEVRRLLFGDGSA